MSSSPYCLTEAVRLITKGPIADDNDETLNELRLFYRQRGIKVEPTSDIIPFLEQYGIGLKYADYAHPNAGNFNHELYSKWIEARRQLCERRGWLARDIIKYGGDTQILFGKQLYLPPYIMELIWKLTESTSGTTLDKIIIDKDKSGIIYRKIQIPFISWLNKNELNRISARLKDLSPNKTNPAIKPLWEFTDLARQVIEGWYIRNNLGIPKIEYPGIKLTLWARFEARMDEIVQLKGLSETDLWALKEELSHYPAPYFQRYAKLKGITLDDVEALAWRKNPRFRKARSKKSAK